MFPMPGIFGRRFGQMDMETSSANVGTTLSYEGNKTDGRHYWLTPPSLMADLQTEFNFDFDACPFPKPDTFDGLTANWGDSTYVNPPFGSVMVDGKKKGPTAWARKALEENRKGKRVVIVFPLAKWVLMLLSAGAEVRNLGNVKWCATEDGIPGRGCGYHIAAFILKPDADASSLNPSNPTLSEKP